MATGALVMGLCRPDLATKVSVGTTLFLGFFIALLLGLILSAPGYVECVWDLDALGDTTIFRRLVEELLFALALGTYWSGVYEHANWHRVVSAH